MSWQPAQDPKTGRTYYYNPSSGETSWTKPSSSKGAASAADAVTYGRRPSVLAPRPTQEKPAHTNEGRLARTYSQVGRHLLEKIEGDTGVAYDMHATIINPDLIYPSLQSAKNVQWPPVARGKKVSYDSWGSWKAAALGVRGVVVHTWKAAQYCIDGHYPSPFDHSIVLLKVNGTSDYCCIAEEGLRYDQERKTWTDDAQRLDNAAIAHEARAVDRLIDEQRSMVDSIRKRAAGGGGSRGTLTRKLSMSGTSMFADLMTGEDA